MNIGLMEKERDHLKDPGIDVKMDLRETGIGV
jgi:hypothetical protein